MKITWNKKYTIISTYAVIVFVICFSIYRITCSWEDSKLLFSNIYSLLSPFLAGMMLAYFMNFLIVFFEKRFLSRLTINKKPLSLKHIRALSITISYVLMGTLFFLFLAIVIPQLVKSIVDFIAALPQNTEKFLDYIYRLSELVNKNIYYFDPEVVNKTITENIPNSLNKVTQMITNLIPNLISFTTGIAYTFLNILLALIISIYILSRKESGAEKSKKIIVALFPKKTASTIIETSIHSHKVFSDFFVGKLVDSLIIGIMCFILLIMFKIPYPLLLSLLVGITNIIPYFGPFIGGIIGFILLLFVTPMPAVVFGIIVFALQQFDGNILGPKILGYSIGLSPFWIIFSVLIFGRLFGVLGMLLGAPLFSVFKAIFEKYIDAKYESKIKSEDNV